MKKVKINILRVFVNDEKQFGNPVGIILDENQKISSEERQNIATKLNFSESVFISDLQTGTVSIFNPKKEVNFAGHALVGTSYFMNTILNKPTKYLVCRVDQLQTWQENDLTWIRASLQNTPPWIHKQLSNASLVENLSPIPKQHTIVWAWLNQDKGIIRARTFAPDWGIPEDEANGSGSMQLADKLQRKLEIHHGKGSVIYAQPANPGFADVGGRIEIDLPQIIFDEK